MSTKTGNADTTEATCPKCGHALWGHTEFPGLWCCFYDAALGKLCECHASEAPLTDRPFSMIFHGKSAASRIAWPPKVPST